MNLENSVCSGKEMKVTSVLDAAARIGDSHDTAAVRFQRSAYFAKTYGIKRGKMYALWSNGHIKGITLKAPGSLHGVRLWFVPSVEIYLARLLAEQNPEVGDA